MTTTLTGRRISFSLRTLFVAVTVVAAAAFAVSSQLNWAHQRQMIRRKSNVGCAFRYENGQRAPATGLLRLLGEASCGEVIIWEASSEEMREARRLFPEAIVKNVPRDWRPINY